jgi:DNA-binding response OmpR family regulator
MKNSILLIEDEENIREAVRYILIQENYSVDIAANGQQGLDLARQLNPSLILLDIMLPELDGIEVCRAIRKESSVPIIMLSAKGEELDKVLSLELGADDYITKPFGKHELLARIRAVLRRASLSTQQVNQSEILQSKNLILNKNSHIVTLKGIDVAMSPWEFSVLTLLMENPNRALTRDQILEFIWGKDWFGDTRTVDVHIRWLRLKIEDDPTNPLFIITVRGVGYRFEDQFTSFN